MKRKVAYIYEVIRPFLFITLLLPTFLFAQKDTLATVVVKDKTRYSADFLTQLRSFNYSTHYQLFDSMLVIGQLDTAYFPTDLPLKRSRLFSGRSKDTRYDLTLSRINYTTIYFSLAITKTGNPPSKREGYADIGVGFFLASEVDEDEKTGMAYGSTEYSHETAECALGIRIGMDDKKKLRARIVGQCKDKPKGEQLINSPTLYEK